MSTGSNNLHLVGHVASEIEHRFQFTAAQAVHSLKLLLAVTTRYTAIIANGRTILHCRGEVGFGRGDDVRRRRSKNGNFGLAILAVVAGTVLSVVNWASGLLSPDAQNASSDKKPIASASSLSIESNAQIELSPNAKPVVKIPGFSTGVNLATPRLAFVKGDKVAFRTGPNKQSNLLNQLNSGHIVEIIQITRGWARVRDPSTGRAGWIAASLLTEKMPLGTAHTEIRQKAKVKTQPTVPKQQANADSGRCDPNYSGKCVPIDSDVDCAGGKGNGPSYVRGPVNVVGTDIYDLDRDGDGVGCERR